MSRKIKLNMYGNWVGYVGKYRTEEFGTDKYAAFYWLRSGVNDSDVAWDSEELHKTDIQWQLVKHNPAKAYITEKDIGHITNTRHNKK